MAAGDDGFAPSTAGLLYSVALHRYLRWRLPGYSPERHLGPVQYHFVRGMIGPDTPSGCGVFQWDAGRACRRPVRPVGGVYRERRRRTAESDAAAARLAVAETGFLRASRGRGPHLGRCTSRDGSRHCRTRSRPTRCCWRRPGRARGAHRLDLCCPRFDLRARPRPRRSAAVAVALRDGRRVAGQRAGHRCELRFAAPCSRWWILTTVRWSTCASTSNKSRPSAGSSTRARRPGRDRRRRRECGA